MKNFNQFSISRSFAIRVLLKLALLEKIDDFLKYLSQILRTMCVHMAEKFGLKSLKKGDFSKRMRFQKNSIVFLNKEGMHDAP
jgi:hypothetical protein